MDAEKINNTDNAPEVEETEEIAVNKSNGNPEEFTKESIEEDSAFGSNSKKKDPKPFRLITTLTSICLVVSLLLAVVNAATKDRIEENTIAEKAKTISSIFPDSTSNEKYNVTDDGSEIFLVYKGDKIEGYSVYVRTDGFDGDMYSMVGIGSDYSTKGVGIVSLSETPGVGTKVNTGSYLSLYAGKPHDNPLEGVDAISGASISSRALRSGIEKAHSYDVDLEKIAKEKGTEVLYESQSDINRSETERETETGQESTGVIDNSGDVSGTTLKTNGEQNVTEDVEFIDNRPDNNYQYVVIGTTGNPSYELEILRDDETKTFAVPDVTEPEPVPVDPVVTKQKDDTKKPETTKKAETPKVTESSKQPQKVDDPVPVSETKALPNTVEEPWTDGIGRKTEPVSETDLDSEIQD